MPSIEKHTALLCCQTVFLLVIFFLLFALVLFQYFVVMLFLSPYLHVCQLLSNIIKATLVRSCPYQQIFSCVS